MTNDFDAFSIELLEEAKRFLEKATESDDSRPHMHAALLLGFSALESHVNGLADELLLRHGLTIMDEAILSERDVRLIDGQWTLSSGIKFYRLEDRLSFLFRKFSHREVGKLAWWSTLHEALQARNALVHPRSVVDLQPADVERFLSCIIVALDDLYQALFGRGHPAKGRGLHSTMTF